MSSVNTAAATLPAGAEATGLFARLRSWWGDVWVMTRRNLIHIRREPMQLSDVTIQPVLFTLLFIYVFGSAMVLKGGGSYKEFALAGLLVMNLTTSSVGTAIGLSMDLTTGVINRLRTLPMSPTAILVGRTLSDLFAAAVCTTIVVVTGLAIGWRPDAGLASVLAGLGVGLLFSFALSWGNACLGMAVSGAESAQGLVFIVIFPLAFVSNVFVPTQGMPAWLATIANWNPVSAVASALRTLFGNPNPSSAIQAWPMQHPVTAAVCWSLLILAVSVPLAGRLYRRRTRD
jgi:ABC-2 type transport system permease protein